MHVRLLIAALALLVVAPCAYQSTPASAQETAANTEEKFSKEELDQILAPIALYPDDLLSNVLMAATYPLEVVQAARWIRKPENAKLKGDALTKALEKQDWDPSVKSLTQFSDVLAMMSEQLEWTEKLGDAVLVSQADVMDRIQLLREKAEQAGNLESNEHLTVTSKTVGGDEYIYIEPASPEVVYVPVYEPDVYGSWWYPDYPPYYWGTDVVYVDDFYWGEGAAIIPALWHWSRPRWHRHYIHISPHKYNRLHRHKRVRSSRWQHDAHHRRGVRYKGAKSWRHADHSRRDIKRGRLGGRDRDGKHVLNPDSDRRLDSRSKLNERFKSIRERRRNAARVKVEDRKPDRRIRALKRLKSDKRVLAGPKKHRSSDKSAKKVRVKRDVKRSSAGGKKQRAIRANKGSRKKSFSNSRKRTSAKRSSARKFSRGGRSGVQARRSGPKAGNRGGRGGGNKGRRR